MDGLPNCLLPHWQERSKTADRPRSRIKSVINDAIAQEWGTAGNPACWKGLLDKVMPRRQKLQRGITLRSLIRMKDIEGRSMATFLYWAAAEPRTLHLARIGGTAPTLIPPPRFALDVVKQLGSRGEIAEEAGQTLLLLLGQALSSAKNVYIPYLRRNFLGKFVGFNSFYHLAPPKAKEGRL